MADQAARLGARVAARAAAAASSNASSRRRATPSAAPPRRTPPPRRATARAQPARRQLRAGAPPRRQPSCASSCANGACGRAPRRRELRREMARSGGGPPSPAASVRRMRERLCAASPWGFPRVVSLKFVLTARFHAVHTSPRGVSREVRERSTACCPSSAASRARLAASARRSHRRPHSAPSSRPPAATRHSSADADCASIAYSARCYPGGSRYGENVDGDQRFYRLLLRWGIQDVCTGAAACSDVAHACPRWRCGDAVTEAATPGRRRRRRNRA